MKWLNIEQNSEIWKIARLGNITASQFGTIMTPGKTALEAGIVIPGVQLKIGKPSRLIQ